MVKGVQIADSHLTPADDIDSGSWFPYEIERMPRSKQEAIFYKLQQSTRHAFKRCLEGAASEDPDFLVHLGDVTGGYMERGTMHKTLDEGKRAKAAMDAVAETHVAWGNHDTGYKRLSTLPGADLTWEGVQGSEEAYGPAYWSRKDGDLLSIGIATPIEEYDGDDARVLQLKNDQRHFLEDLLRTHAGSPWMLYAHDPLAIDSLHDTFEPYLQEYKGMIHGDLHIPTTGELLKQAQIIFKRLHPVTKTMAKKSILTPSTAPFGWRGYQYLTTTYENGLATTERKSVSTEGMPENPSPTKLQQVWWFARALMRRRA